MLQLITFAALVLGAGAIVHLHRARCRAEALARGHASDAARLRHQNLAYRMRLRFAGLDERLPDIPDGPHGMDSTSRRPLFQIMAAMPAAAWPPAALDRIDAAMGHPPIAAGDRQRG